MSEAITLPPPSRAAAWLARGVSATWWYTASSVVFFALITLFLWAVLLLALVADARAAPFAVVAFAIGSVVWLGGAVPLLWSYRRRAIADPGERRFSRAIVVELIVSFAGAAILGVAGSSVLLGLAAASFGLCLLTWLPGVRLRLVAGMTVALVIAWIIEARYAPPVPAGDALLHPVFAAFLPAATVVSLWWWDVVVELDRARAAESRLAAVQERLRLAGDLHDLQGHHLQVIALQLELAERMLPRDPEAAAEQVRLARASVDEARQGTRELAGRFRGVPLPDELANAADLLRAAGLRVDLHIAPESVDAPADVLGPVIRESTTNVLKHGGGTWASLSLARTDGSWTLRVANDCGHEPSVLGSGAGLAGIRDRVRAVGGDIRTTPGEVFEVVVTVPVGRDR